MASGYQKGGTDLDSIFAAYHAGWPQASATGYKVGGSDLNGRYAPLSTGSAAAATGYKTGGTDLNAIFAGLGTTGVQVASQPSNVSGSAAAGYPSGTVTSGSATCSFTKGGGSYTYTWHCTNCTANSPNSATTTFSATVNAGSTDNASAYCTGSDGVTSANTSTISVTLQNTTPAQVTDNFNFTAGTHSGTFTNTGYNSGVVGTAYGTMNSGGTLTGGTSISSIYESSSGNATFAVSGFGADPGQNSLVTLTTPGGSVTGANGTYSYSGGVATWTYSLTSYGAVFNFTSGSAYACSVTHTF